MSDFSFYNYSTDDVSEAVHAVTGDTVIYTSIDDEHVFWFILDDDGSIAEDDIGAEGIDDLYPAEVVEGIQAYLQSNYEV